MRHGAAALALAVLLLATAWPAAGATFRVDDSGTVIDQGVIKMKWRRMAPGRAADNTVEGHLRVGLRLDLTRWVNRPVRLYMGLAAGAGEPVQTVWRTQGRLLAGQLRTGGRALVYDGIVGAPVLEETIEMLIMADGQTLTQTQTLQFYFEVETQ